MLTSLSLPPPLFLSIALCNAMLTTTSTWPKNEAVLPWQRQEAPQWDETATTSTLRRPVVRFNPCRWLHSTKNFNHLLRHRTRKTRWYCGKPEAETTHPNNLWLFPGLACNRPSLLCRSPSCSRQIMYLIAGLLLLGGLKGAACLPGTNLDERPFRPFWSIRPFQSAGDFGGQAMGR